VTILWSPTYFTTPEYSLVRQYLDYTAVGWWNMIVLSSGRYLHLREIPFGGYEFHLRWKEWFWNTRAGTGRVLDVLEDLYVTPPGSSTPISAGSVIFEVKYDPRTHAYVVVISNNPNDNHWCFNRFPPVDGSYWYQPGTMRHPDVFVDDGSPYPP
jgi:hypothetical protein